MIGQCATRIFKISYRRLQASREVSNAIKHGPHTLGNGSLECQVAGLSMHNTSLTDVE